MRRPGRFLLETSPPHEGRILTMLRTKPGTRQRLNRQLAAGSGTCASLNRACPVRKPGACWAGLCDPPMEHLELCGNLSGMLHPRRRAGDLHPQQMGNRKFKNLQVGFRRDPGFSSAARIDPMVANTDAPGEFCPSKTKAIDDFLIFRIVHFTNILQFLRGVKRNPRRSLVLYCGMSYIQDGSTQRANAESILTAT